MLHIDISKRDIELLLRATAGSPFQEFSRLPSDSEAQTTQYHIQVVVAGVVVTKVWF